MATPTTASRTRPRLEARARAWAGAAFAWYADILQRTVSSDRGRRRLTAWRNSAIRHAAHRGIRPDHLAQRLDLTPGHIRNIIAGRKPHDPANDKPDQPDDTTS
jgi:DNA-binding transcriptional regulator YdaS (Cro superfamily)